MAVIGSYGRVVFEVSDTRVLTLGGISQTVAARWQEHTVINTKPRSEFLSADLRGMTFSITLDAALGVRPRDMLRQLESMVEGGEVNYLIIGGRPVGGLWKILTMSEAWDVVYSHGELAKATAKITLKEYF